MIPILVLLVFFRTIQSFFIPDLSLFELKWLLLGDWLGQGFDGYSETFDYTGPIALGIYKFIAIGFGRSAFVHHILSSILIIYQASIFNSLLIRNKAFEFSTYVPALLFVILMIAIPDFQSLSPPLISLTFILLVFKNVLRRINNQVTDSLFITSGIYLGIATLVYLPSSVFFFTFLVSFILFSSTILRRLGLYLFSYCLVLTLVGFWYHWRGDFSQFYESFIVYGLFSSQTGILALKEVLFGSLGLLVILILSVVITYTRGRFTNFQLKVQQVLWLFVLSTVAIFLLSNEKALHDLVFIVPFIAFFWTHYFDLLRKPFAKLTFPLILITGLLAYSCFVYSSFMSPLYAQPKSDVAGDTLLIGVDLEAVYSSEMYSPCFDEELCSKGFMQLDQYNGALNIKRILEKTQPKLIEDRIGTVEKLFFRFPQIQAKYRNTSHDTYMLIEN